MTLTKDWKRVQNAFLKVKSNHWSPQLKLFFEPKELRKVDNRGIDFAIRRLLNSEAYADRIRVHGCPPNCKPRNPFRYKHRVYAFLSIKFDESEVGA